MQQGCNKQKFRKWKTLWDKQPLATKKKLQRKNGNYEENRWLGVFQHYGHSGTDSPSSWAVLCGVFSSVPALCLLDSVAIAPTPKMFLDIATHLLGGDETHPVEKYCYRLRLKRHMN